MNTSTALREALHDIATTVRDELSRQEQDTAVAQQAVAWIEAAGDAELQRGARAALMPLQASITARNVDALVDAHAAHDLSPLRALPAEVTHRLFETSAMVCMLLTTTALIPPEMMSQIESMAGALAGSFASGSTPDLGAVFGSMLGGGLGAPDGGARPALPGPASTAAPPPAITRPKTRRGGRGGGGGGGRTPQERFRERLV